MAAVIRVWIGEPVSWMDGVYAQLTMYCGAGVSVGGSGVGVSAGGGGGPGVFVGGTGVPVGADGVSVGTGVAVSVGGIGVSVGVNVGRRVGVQLGVKVNVGRGVLVGCMVGVGARTRSVPTEHPRLANNATVKNTDIGRYFLFVIGLHFNWNQIKSQRHAAGSVL